MKPKEYLSITHKSQANYLKKLILEIYCVAIEIESQLNETSGDITVKDYPHYRKNADGFIPW